MGDLRAEGGSEEQVPDVLTFPRADECEVSTEEFPWPRR